MRRSPRLLLALAAGTLVSLSAVVPASRAASTPGPDPSTPPSAETSAAQPRAEAPSADQPLDQVRETQEEMRFIELTNEERVKRHLNPLTVDPQLITVARLHSAEMRDKAYFNHNSPTAGLRTPLDRFLKACSARPRYACVGENLFYCSVTDVQRGHDAFMNSPAHRENLLFPRFEKMGVGIVHNARGEFWVTEMFLTTSDPLIVAKKTN